MNKEWLKTVCCPMYSNIPVKFNRLEHVTPFLDSMMISKNHRPHIYLEKAEVHFLRNMVWKFGVVAALNDSDYPGAPCNM